MAVYGNFKGTTQPSFKVGKSGKSLYGEPTQPASPSQGDIWLDSGNSAIRVFDGSDWDNGQFIGNLEGFMEFEAKAGENLVKGDVVYVSGSSGNLPIVRKALANSATTMPAFGIAKQTINQNNTGYIVTQGLLTGIDTSSFSQGDTLYVDIAITGKFTNVAPAGESNKIQNIGKIVNSAVGGSIMVGGAGRFNATNALDQGNIFIGNVSGVTVSTPLSNEIANYLDLNTNYLTSDLDSGNIYLGNANGVAESTNLSTALINGGFLLNIVEDTTPQLGGALDVNGQSITSVSNGNIAITPNGTGYVQLDGLNWPQTDGTANQYLQTNGSGTLSFADGPIGYTGSQGVSAIGGSFVYTQSSAASTWTITHNLNSQYLNVEVIDDTGNSLVGTSNYPVINFTSADVTTLTFSTSISGYAAITSGGGVAGSQGNQGFTGSQGTTGFTGSTGFNGSKGDTGFTGSKGDTGFAGSTGFTGSKGDQGVIGFTGSQGVGFTGSQGDQGNVGFTGSQGYSGSQGFTGSQGDQGIIGYTGSQGDQGIIGFTGSQGNQGVIGFTGSKGDQGVIGYTGSKGDTGFNGSAGAENATLDSVTDNGNTTTNSITVGSLQTTTFTSGSNATAGTVTGDWTLTAGSTWQATYADLAEKYTTDGPYEAGTIMKFGGDAELTESDTHNDTRVAGVISDAPAFTMNAGIDGQYLALSGRVPVKVIGTVTPGDLLVSSDTAGHAIVNNNAVSGTIIGKAITADANGVCEALVTLM